MKENGSQIGIYNEADVEKITAAKDFLVKANSLEKKQWESRGKFWLKEDIVTARTEAFEIYYRNPGIREAINDAIKLEKNPLKKEPILVRPALVVKK